METVKIKCRCKDCEYSEYICPNYYHCYHWKYETGESPNTVCGDDFCSEGEPRK